MSITSKTRLARPQAQLPDVAWLRRWMEQLLDAADMAALLQVCEELVAHLKIRGHLHWQDTGTVTLEAGPSHLRLVEHVLGTRALWFDAGDAALSVQAREELNWIGRIATARVRQLAENGRLCAAISRLAMAERVQRATCAIAEQAEIDQPMSAMTQALHGIVSSVLYAENFYIVLYDAATQNVRFPCYIDAVDTDAPLPDQDIPLQTLEHSLTWTLLRGTQPMLGSEDELKQQFGNDVLPLGPHCEHWLGVPMLRSGNVVGGLVAQSYRADMRYSRQDMDLLTHLARHVETAFERRAAHLELGHRVAERTSALREANRILRQQVLQRRRGERLQAALFRIAELANASDTLENFYAAVHQAISGLLYARNVYIALLDEDAGMLTFPYFVDEVDLQLQPRAHGHGVTEYVLRTGMPLLASRTDFERLIEQGEVNKLGSLSVCWLGVPLKFGDKPIGVLALQSYSPRHVYNANDQELLTFVSYHIANALQRKHAATSLQLAYAGLERRVAERTRALALANRDLREQINERERVERRLKYETLHDSLTGLPNRTLLLQRLDQALTRYLADSSSQFAVLFIDLDRFKVINDSVGHLVGDDLLFQVGGRIRACVKTRDVVARLGGDEFAVLLESIDNSDNAVQIAERIIRELHTPFQLGAKEVFTSASIGIALSAARYRQPEELLRDADVAMYNAKDDGRHRTALFDDRLRRQALSLLDMENDLRHALARNEFVPFYQPIVELESGLVVGYEALLRWHHPQRGLLAPDDFLLIAQESGCAESIDWRIFEQVCAHAPHLVSGDGFISVNVSGRHFRSADLDQRLLALFKQYAVPPHCMRVEVTEHTLLENPDQAKRILQNLRNHGVGVVLDDFGTGYSSLSYLHQYPFETLKIDRSFITGLPIEETQSQALAIVRTIQVLADSLQMRVIAEGIEEDFQRVALLRIGCRFGQGFLFARAQPANNWPQAGMPFHLP